MIDLRQILSVVEVLVFKGVYCVPLLGNGISAFATATETAADGQKRAEIKKAEGIKQARILAAEGESEAIRLVNEAADKYFVGNAQLLRRLETVEKALSQNAKIVVPINSELVNVIGDLAGVVPIKKA